MRMPSSPRLDLMSMCASNFLLGPNAGYSKSTRAQTFLSEDSNERSTDKNCWVSSNHLCVDQWCSPGLVAWPLGAWPSGSWPFGSKTCFRCFLIPLRRDLNPTSNLRREEGKLPYFSAFGLRWIFCILTDFSFLEMALVLSYLTCLCWPAFRRASFVLLEVLLSSLEE